jgi:hypothetical protein
MQLSSPHWVEVEQVLPVGGIARQVLARQNSPSWQSVFFAQVGSQRFALQASPVAQSAAVEHFGSDVQVPLWHPQVLEQSEVLLHAQPEHPHVHWFEPS